MIESFIEQYTYEELIEAAIEFSDNKPSRVIETICKKIGGYPGYLKKETVYKKIVKLLLKDLCQC